MVADNVLTELKELKSEIARNLAASAVAYYRVGVAEFLRVERQAWTTYQAAVGNLAIAIELMLKAFVASRCFRKLYVGVPEELDVVLRCEKPPSVFSLRPFENALRSFEYKTIELDQAVNIYWIYFPEQKTDLHSYFSLLSTTRNISVHGALAEFQRFDLGRVSYLAIKLMQHLQHEKILFEPMDIRTKSKKIVARFDQQRVERVKNKIREAKIAAKKLTGNKLSIVLAPDDLEGMALPCPICGSDVYVTGYTSPDDTGEEGSSSLSFHPDGFLCEECGLEITDSRDFPLVGLEELIDRSDDWDEWCKQNAESVYN